MQVTLDVQTMAERAARGIGKVDLYGKRGVTLVNEQEIEAMAMLLYSLGLISLHPGQPTPEALPEPPLAAIE